MPKKRTYNFKQLKGSSSLSCSKAAGASSDGGETSQSVNERLSELRKLEGREAAARTRQLVETVNQRSVPPDVRGILGISESAPPKPKRAEVIRTRDRFRTPGPAPPKSWVAGNRARVGWTSGLFSTGTRRGIQYVDRDRFRPATLLRFSCLTGLEDGDVGDLQRKPSKLSHMILKKIASCWDTLDEDDYPAISEVPVRLRLKLLSYICYYGPAIHGRALDALLQGHETIKHLDLAGLIGYNGLTVKRLIKTGTRRHRQQPYSNEVDVTDSWDADDSFEASLQLSPQLTPFSTLTHLCLSHPGPRAASWRDLLSLSKHITQVTHLSLAYWPRPTLTPNLATATVASPNGLSITAGGSHYYSGLDGDMAEPASIIRQLSSHLLCLQWFDLEGCQGWAPVLGRLGISSEELERMPEDENDSSTRIDTWESRRHRPSSIFITNWKNLIHVNLAQGWLPTHAGFTQLCMLAETGVASGTSLRVLKYLKAELAASDSPMLMPDDIPRDQLETEKNRARVWLEAEHKIEMAALNVNRARRPTSTHPAGFRPAIFYNGWSRKL